jgi:subtilase family serine protease
MLLLIDKVTEFMKIKTDLYNSIISVFSIMLIILGVVPNLVLALDGQLGDGADSTNDTPHPDLIIEKFYTDPTAPTPGSNVIIYASVKNIGNLASNPVYLTLSIDGVGTSYYSDSISPEAEVTFSQAWTAPNSEGIVILKASIDGIDNSQKEIDLLVENPRPDLIIQNIVSDPAVPQAGQALNFTFSVVNQGTAPSVEALATYYTTNMISGQDISIPSLVVGASANLSFSLAPDQVKEGQMEVKVVADSGNTLLERNESNNVLTKTLKVKGLPPDLVVEAISLNPATPKVGDNISFIATIKNIGSGTSPASKLKYFINGAGDANNVMLNGSLPVPALAIGEAKQCTFYWVPTGEGSIVVTALVDPDSVISETDETNNRNTLTATITMEST